MVQDLERGVYGNPIQRIAEQVRTRGTVVNVDGTKTNVYDSGRTI